MPEWLDIGVFGVALFVMLVGWFGLLVPFFPGIEVIWITALVYGLINKFGTLGGWMFALITLIALFAMVIDNILMAKLARREGAAWKSLLLGFLGGMIGIVIWPPWGGLVGAPLVVLLFEYLRVKDWKQAWVALRGLALGWLASLVVRFLLAGAMVGLWLIWAFNR
jgi:hypothetical protein